jgi:small-conductance mechanosensitive channel
MALHAASFLDRHTAVVNAVLSILVALAVVQLLKQVFDRRAERIAQAVMRGELSPEVDTRIRLVRRMVYATVIGLGVATALSQFDEVRTVGSTLLASGAIAAAVVGFAARQTLANIVAGIMIAITQPIRVGDWVAFEDDYGQVEDVTLNFTTLRTGAGRRVIIPNEKIASSVVRNDTLGEPTIGLDVSVWIPAGADAARALAVLRDETGGDVSVADAVPWGIRLALGGEPVAPAVKPVHEADLRARAVLRLQAEGLLSEGAGPAPPNP